MKGKSLVTPRACCCSEAKDLLLTRPDPPTLGIERQAPHGPWPLLAARLLAPSLALLRLVRGSTQGQR
jgi:hypothetical protein